MREIIIPKPQDESLISQLTVVYKIFKDSEKGEALDFYLSKLQWLCPALLLPLAAYINFTKSEFKVKGLNEQAASYLSAIKFPKGIDSVSLFSRQIQSNKNFIPIGVLKRNKGVERERLESLFGEMILKAIGNVNGARNAIYYPITELITNIFEHSKKDEGFIFGQYYPNKKYLDICIVDYGRGLAASYKEENNLIFSDEEAISEVMKGHSTKANKERGYGIRTSKGVVCRALKGEFLLISGSAALISNTRDEKLISLMNFYWQGVIISYRIPLPSSSIDITPYLE